MSTAAEHPWGRVDADGNVFVKRSTGEHAIGQWVAGEPAEAIAFYERRFDSLTFEVELLEKRINAGSLGPDDAQKSVRLLAKQVEEAQALGDLDSLASRLEALHPIIEKSREQRRVEREAKLAEAATAKEAIAAEAETIASSDDWRAGADRLRELLDEWKKLPRLARATDDALWHRFSTARTAYTKRRKTHFSELAARRDAAQKVKEALIVEAEELSSSTDWGPTTGRYRELMKRWKAAGSAPRNVEDKLWKRFRAAQDVFFSSRDAANAELDAEYSKNAEVKAELLVEAEALLPIKDVEAARKAFHSIAERWEEAGKVPRDKVREFEGRLRAVEQAIREADDNEWRRTDPEKSARADEMITKLEQAITAAEAELDAAKAAGNDKAVKKLTENLESRKAFLEIARKTASDFS